MPKALSSIACMILICSLYSLAADRSMTSFASLPPEAQASIKAALQRDLPVQDFTLTASDGMDKDQFGVSVAIDGDTVVVGALQGGNQSLGAAYVFVKPANGWTNMTQIAELTPSDGEFHDCFGCSVAISGNTIVVGDSGLDVNGNPAQGAAYVFVKPRTGWTNMTQTAKLTASDGVSDAQFGTSVGISGDTVLVGAPGASTIEGEAYVFVEPRSGWKNMTQTAELTPSDGSDGDYFGLSVSISGKSVLVGAPEYGVQAGLGYIFVEPAGGWSDMTQTAELTPSDGQTYDEFGFSASIDGNTAVIGAPYHLSGGAAYVFVEPIGGWIDTTQTVELESGASSSCMGWSTSIEGKVIIAGSQCNTGFRGAAFVFLEPSNGWRSTSIPALRLSVPFNDGEDSFGASVAVSGMTAVVGAPNAPTSPPNFQQGPGEAFIFTPQ